MSFHAPPFLSLFLLPLLLLAGCSPHPQKSTNAPPQEIQSVRDLGGKKAAVMNGSIFPILTERFVKGVQYLPFNDNPSAIQALRSGKVDVFLCDEPIARLTIAKFPQDLRFVEIYAEDTYGIAFPKDSPLTPKVRAIIQGLKTSGELDRLVDKWCRNADASKKTLITWNHNKNFTGKNGTLHYLSDSTSEPMAYMGPNGQLIGLELEVIRRIAYDLDMTLDAKPTGFDGLIPALLSGKADAVGGSMSITKERQEKVDFPEAHYAGGLSIVARNTPEASAKITKLSQLYGRKIGVQQGTTWADLVKEHFISSIPVPFNSVDEQPQALLRGDIQAFLADAPLAQALVRQNPKLYILTKKLTADAYAFAFAKNQGKLRDDFNAQLKTLTADGTLKKLQDKWFDGAPATQVMPPAGTSAAKGTLQLAVNPQMAPFAYMNQNKMMGYDLELAQLIALRLGYDLKPVSMDWEASLKAVQNGELPMAAGAITVTAERSQTMLFSTPTYEGGIVVVTSTPEKAKQVTTPWEWCKQAVRELKNSFYRTLILESRWKMLAKGLKTTIVISLLSAILGTALAILLCMLRRSQIFGCKQLTTAFISLMQGTPILVFLMILYYLIFANVDVNPVLIAVVGFGLNFAAYVSEMIRTGLEAIPKGQYEAAMALGFTRGQTYAKVIIPQVLKRILPIYRGEFISMLKSTSIVGYIAIEDLTQMSDNIRSRTYEAFFPLILTSLIYFLTAYVIVFFIKKLDQKIDPRHRRNAAKGGQH